jgi:hypothetical protein
MSVGPELLLIGAVAAVGVLHTVVPDHWVPIALIARQRGWSKAETARVALQAGIGHVGSTLLIALLVWIAGVAFATRFGHAVDTVASLALVGFGGWIGISAWRELRGEGRHDHDHGHEHGHDHSHGHGHEHGHSHAASLETRHAGHDHDDDAAHGHEGAPAPDEDPLYAPLRGDVALLTRHVHRHRHGRRATHTHWHDHRPATAHLIVEGIDAEPPLHEHRHRMSAHTALLLILGSSPMIEGIPAFFAAGKYGVGLIAAMSAVFALSTIATYVLLCTSSTAGLQRVSLGPFERYGEVLSGGFIALVGVVFWLWPAL